MDKINNIVGKMKFKYYYEPQQCEIWVDGHLLTSEIYENKNKKEFLFILN